MWVRSPDAAWPQTTSSDRKRMARAVRAQPGSVVLSGSCFSSFFIFFLVDVGLTRLLEDI